MRRLFSTTAQGAPGAGLLLMRLAAGTALLVQTVPVLMSGPPPGPALFEIFSTGLAILLLAGLGTPVVGALVALDALWNFVSHGYLWHWIMVACLGAALALIGPGAWSVDALLFGWKRIEIGDRTDRAPPPG